MKRENVVLVVLMVLVVVSLVAVAFAYERISLVDSKTEVFYDVLSGGRWECIAKNCSVWMTEEEWIVKNCRLNSEKDGMVCSIKYETNLYDVPLSSLNTSSIRSCSVYTCLTEVYIRNSLEVFKND